jgi:hypothetical protein
MLEQSAPEQSQGNSGSPSLQERIANAFSPQPKAPQAQPPKGPPQQPQQQAQEAPEPQESQEQEASAEVEGEPQPQEETFEFEVEGEKYVLPKKLEKSVLQERDYTQKAQSLAETRRLVEVKEQQFRVRELQHNFQNEIANESRQIQMIDTVLEQQVNWQSMSTDEAFRYKIQLDDLAKQKERLQQSIAQKEQGFKKQQAEAQQALHTKTAEALKALIPTWSPQVAKEVTEHFHARGYTEADFQLLNSRPEFIQAAWKAMQYDKLQAKATPAVQQAKQVKTTSANPMSAETKNYLNFRKAISKTQRGSPQHQQLVRDRIAAKFSR